jgi:CubicO group peptidase (beta-lactamase class C family)
VSNHIERNMTGYYVTFVRTMGWVIMIRISLASLLALLITLTALNTQADEIKPNLNKSGPEANIKFCADQGYPLNKRYIEPCARVGSFTSMHKLFAHSPIQKTAAVRQLEYAEVSEIDTTLKNLANTVLKTEPVTALLIWRKGKLVIENYQYDRQPNDLFMSFSMHKTITGLLIDVAVQNKKINSVSDPVTKYLKSLRGTGWEKVSIENALRMSSGFPANQRKLLVPLLYRDRDRIELIKEVFKSQDNQPGKKFLYNDVDTYVLGMLTEEVYRKDQGDLISEFIWRKIGAEANAEILTTKSGQHLVSASILARPRDYLRLGLLVLEGGINYLGEQIISPSWISGMFGQTDKTKECPFGRNCNHINPWGYGQQVWLPPYPNTTAFIGKYGQLILISKDTDTVLVMLSVSDPRPIDQSTNIRKLIEFLSTN